MINWTYFPHSSPPPTIVERVISVFEDASLAIDSSTNNLKSNSVLAAVRAGLESHGFRVESGKKADQKIKVPVLFGRSGKVLKSFEADAWHEAEQMVLEVEAGRGVTNNQFLKDFFQACMMQDVAYFGVAVRNVYRANKNFEAVETFFDTMYAGERLRPPLKGIVVIGY